MTTIKEIYLSNEISKEAFDVCFYNEIDFLEELKEYHSKNGSFKGFRNCNSKTNNELVLICLETFDSVSFSNDTNTKTNEFVNIDSAIKDSIVDDLKEEGLITNNFTIFSFLNSLSVIKKLSIDSFLNITFFKLSVRSQNALKKNISNKINLEGFSKLIFQENFFGIRNIHNIGIKSVIELDSFISILNDFIIKVISCEDEQELNEFKIDDSINFMYNSVKIHFSILNTITGLNFIQKQTVNSFISQSLFELSDISYNYLKTYLSNDINIDSFSRVIFQDTNFKFRDTQKTKNNSAIELENYLSVLKAYILQVYLCKDQTELEAMSVKFNLITFSDKIKDLNLIQEQIINNHILLITSKLSVRSGSAINIYLENKLNIHSFSDKIFSNRAFKIIELQNIGKGSIKELGDYLKQIKQFSIRVINLKDEKELKKLETEFYLKKIFKNKSIPNEIINPTSIFILVDYLINKKIIFDKVETFIFKSTFNAYIKDEHKTTEHICEVLGITRERVRQRKISLLEKISSKFIFLKCFDKNLLSNYNIDSDQFSIVISNDKAEHINRIDDTNFSKQFIALVISFLFEEKFNLIGNKEDVLLFRESSILSRHNWKNFYLIQTRLHQVFSFENLIEDLAGKIKELNNKTYKLNFKSYLSKFFKKEDSIFLDNIFPICEIIINEELGIYLDNEENIVFKRNVYKTLPEYAFEALEIIGKPSHIDEINKQIKILKPDYNSNITGGLLKRSLGFIPYGRANIFGLKKWDAEKRNLKGGTIRSIAEEFLQNYSKPIKYHIVANYVLKYRPESNIKSIIYNLKMEENNRFVFFKDSLIGLKSKNYQIDLFSTFESNNPITPRSWAENYKELLNFISNNNKFPSATSTSIEEKRISIWFYKQTSKINKKLLDESKTKLILDVKNNNKPREQKSNQFKSDSYSKLFNFVELNKRLPSGGRKEESTLYNFFYNLRKGFDDGDLDSEEKLKFIQIAKLLQQ